jgi:hypothetical protein
MSLCAGAVPYGSHTPACILAFRRPLTNVELMFREASYSLQSLVNEPYWAAETLITYGSAFGEQASNARRSKVSFRVVVRLRRNKTVFPYHALPPKTEALKHSRSDPPAIVQPCV